MKEKRFEKDCDENVCSFDYSTLDTYYEYNGSNEEIIEWNKHSSNAQYRNLKHIAEILNIKQMRLESLMKHREEIGKLFDRIDEQQATNSALRTENNHLIDVIKEYAKKYEEQQDIITELERKVKKYAKIGEEQLKQIMDLQDELNECRARPTLATDERGVVKVEYKCR